VYRDIFAAKVFSDDDIQKAIEASREEVKPVMKKPMKSSKK
jgi:hypothetical protein